MAVAQAPLATPTRARLAAGFTWPLAAALLPARTGLFVFWQVVLAAGLLLTGTAAPWAASAGWWLVNATLANLVTLALMAGLLRREGGRLTDLYRADRRHLGRDLLVVLGMMVVAAPAVMIPGVLLSGWLFPDPNVIWGILVQRLPMWAALVSAFGFPVTVALAELPMYFGYLQPRLAALSGRPWLATLVAALWLSAQHMALPLVLDWHFLLYRGLMFLPFALLVGAGLHWRPRLLPYMLVVHGLMDLQMGLMVLGASR